MSDNWPQPLLEALTPLARDMYHQGYADALEAAARVVKLLGARPELAVESLLASAQKMRPKAPHKAANRSEPKASPSSSSPASDKASPGP